MSKRYSYGVWSKRLRAFIPLQDRLACGDENLTDEHRAGLVVDVLNRYTGLACEVRTIKAGKPDKTQAKAWFE